MAEGQNQSGIHRAVMTYFPMFIATLSLATSLFNGYLNNKFVDIIQHNVERVEYLKTCKDIIDAYFQVKFRAGVVNGNRQDGSAAGGDLIEARNAASRFAALGTYLANLRDDATRERYTRLSLDLDRIVGAAARTPPAEFGKLFDASDAQFATMNDDCVKSAKNVQM
jgi:hypothetical protein